jgi:hypothetical protein
MNLGALLALLWLREKVKEAEKEDPCANMTPGSPAWLSCKEANR